MRTKIKRSCIDIIPPRLVMRTHIKWNETFDYNTEFSVMYPIEDPSSILPTPINNRIDCRSGSWHKTCAKVMQLSASFSC